MSISRAPNRLSDRCETNAFADNNRAGNWPIITVQRGPTSCTPYAAAALDEVVLDQRLIAAFGDGHLLCRLWLGVESAGQTGSLALQRPVISE